MGALSTVEKRTGAPTKLSMNGRISTGLNLVPLALSRSKDGHRLMLALWIAWLFLVTPATLYAEKLRVSSLGFRVQDAGGKTRRETVDWNTGVME